MQVGNPYAWILIATAVIAAVAVPFVWPRRFSPGARPVLVSLVAVMVWSGAYALELMNTSLEGMLFWTRVAYPAMVCAPSAFLLYALEYSGMISWLKWRQVRYFLIVPVLVVALVWTNDLHHLFYRQVGTVASAGWTYFQIVERGPFYWLNVIYAYLVLVAATVILLRALVRSPQLYHRQIVVILIGVFAPWIANILYLAGLTPFDPTSLGFAVTSLAVAFSSARLKLFDVVPMARDVLVENLNLPVLALNDLGEVIDANRAAREWITAKRGKSALATLTVADLSTLFKIDLHPYLTNSNHSLTLDLGQAAPDWRTLLVQPLSAVPGGQVEGWLLSLQDINQRRLSEGVLADARDQALQESFQKSQLIAAINHDLQSPLSALLEAGALLLENQEDPLAARQRKVVAGIFDTTNQISRYINDLAEHPAVMDSKIRLYPTEFVPAELLARLRALFARRAESKGLHLDLTLERGLPAVLVGDLYRIEQILANLLENAIQATPAGSVSLRFYCPDSGHWAAEMKNTGAGFPSAARERGFQPSAKTAAPVEKAGTGLALVGQLVLLMQGQMQVNSQPGSGSVYRVILPLDRLITVR